MIGNLICTDGDLFIRTPDKVYPILDNDFYSWLNIYIDSNGDPEVQFEIESEYAKFITDGKETDRS